MQPIEKVQSKFVCICIRVCVYVYTLVCGRLFVTEVGRCVFARLCMSYIEYVNIIINAIKQKITLVAKTNKWKMKETMT